MTRIHRICFILTFTIPYGSKAQPIPDSLKPYYQIAESAIDIHQIHEPLDGKAVTMIPYKLNNKFGFVDKKNKRFIIQPQFDNVWAVYKEGAIVETNGNIGVINSAGKYIIQPTACKKLTKEKNWFHLAYVSLVNNKLPADVNAYQLHVYISLNGKTGFSEECHDYKTFLNNDTLAWFRYGNMVSIRSLSGKSIKKIKLDENNKFMGICSNRLVYRKKEGEKYYYNTYDIAGKKKHTQQITQFNLRGPYVISKTLYAYNNAAGETYYANNVGFLNYGIKANDIGFIEYEEGFEQKKYAIVQNFDTELYGVIDNEGNTIIPFQYKSIYACNNGFLLNDTTNKITYISEDRRKKCTKINQSALYTYFMFNQAYPYGYYNNLMVVPPPNYNFSTYLEQDENENTQPFIYVDTACNVAIELSLQYIYAGNFHDGLAVVMDKTMHMGFINTKGELKIPCLYKPYVVVGTAPQIYMPYFNNGYAYIAIQNIYIDTTGKRYAGIEEQPNTTLAQALDILTPPPPPATGNTDYTVFKQVEQMPEFPGGYSSMAQFIQQRLVYPAMAKEIGIMGKVIVSFVVEADGTIADVKLTKGIGYGCDEEAIRVIRSMPKWKPGIQNGKAVNTYMSLPIRFQLVD